MRRHVYPFRLDASSSGVQPIGAIEHRLEHFRLRDITHTCNVRLQKGFDPTPVVHDSSSLVLAVATGTQGVDTLLGEQCL